jgi:hypothetical protein
MDVVGPSNAMLDPTGLSLFVDEVLDQCASEGVVASLSDAAGGAVGTSVILATSHEWNDDAVLHLIEMTTRCSCDRILLASNSAFDLAQGCGAESESARFDEN